MCVQARVEQAVYNSVREVTTPSQGVLKEVRSNIFEAVVIAVSVLNNICDKRVSDVGVKLYDVRGFDEPILQMGLAARVVEVTEEECWSVILRTLKHRASVAYGLTVGRIEVTR